jgi:phytoene dehydrogenase-like protein
VSTLRAPIGTFGDRLRILRLALRLLQTSDEDIFRAPDTKTHDYLRAGGFSEKIIQRLFKPFFAGVCLDPEIGASSRVFRYIFKVFAEGNVALPVRGMGAIAEQLAEGFPDGCIRTGSRVQTLEEGGVVLASGHRIRARAVVLATEGPETARLIGLPKTAGSCGELCLYFAAEAPPIAAPYLVLNGNGTGWVNSLTVPSLVVPSYAPAGQALVSVVVIGHMSADDATAENMVRRELSEWFGKRVGEWRHLKTDRIVHALPIQSPPMPNPTVPKEPIKRGVYACGEHGSVPGIQWALLSGRLTAKRVLKDLALNRSA